jgi:hypothetical protein
MYSYKQMNGECRVRVDYIYQSIDGHANHTDLLCQVNSRRPKRYLIVAVHLGKSDSKYESNSREFRRADEEW